MYLAGGMATHLYVAVRGTTDVDAEYSHRILFPDDLIDRKRDTLFLDTHFNASFSLVHEDYQDDAFLLDTDTRVLEVRVLTPVDLVLSKIARFSQKDQFDIDALVRARLISPEELEVRAEFAFTGYVVGNITSAQTLVKRVIEQIKDFENSQKKLITKPDERFRERLSALPALERCSGACFTFWQQATAAIKASGGAEKVDWTVVERKTIHESIGEHGQAPETVADVVCECSPGTTTHQKQNDLRAYIKQVIPGLQWHYERQCYDKAHGLTEE